MTAKYNNIFQGVLQSVKGSPFSAWMLTMSILLLVIGINNFAEDTYSSFAGVQMIENILNMRPASWEFTYWAMSLFFQVSAIVFFFIYFSNRKENWIWLWFGFAAQFFDFVADIWYRSNEQLFTSPQTFIVSFFLTFIFFTLGSEVAITIGFGLSTALFKDGVMEMVKIAKSIVEGISNGLREISGGNERSNDRRNGNEYQRPTPQRHNIDQETQKRLNEFHNQRGGGKQPKNKDNFRRDIRDYTDIFRV